jgi:adenylate cyclase
MAAIRSSIALKIFGVALGLLILMAIVALLNLRMTRTVDAQLVVIDENYVPAVATLAQAHIHKLEESSTSRRLASELLDGDRSSPDYAKSIEDLHRRVQEAGDSAERLLAEARQNVNDQINDTLDFDDNVALARLDSHVEFLQQIHQRYGILLTSWLAAAEAGNRAGAEQWRVRLDEWRDDWDQRMSSARQEMRLIAKNAILGTRAYQERNVEIGLALLAIATLIGAIVAAAVTMGMVRPVRRLLAGTVAIEGGELDTVIPVTSSDEIGRLTASFNTMVGELRIKAQIRETFGKYVDPRIVEGLIDRPDLTDSKGARRRMTILFCDMQGFTSFSEGMTPSGLVTVMNRYLTVLSEPVLRNDGIIDKYIGDAIMAFWGQPFTAEDAHARLACLAAIEMMAALPAFQAELPELMGIRRGIPKVNVRIGIATGEVVVGNIGSEQTRNYTVIGDTVNIASRLESGSKAYGTRILMAEATQVLAGDAIETREIDSVVVVGKSEPERVFELLGRKGEVSAELIELRDAFAAALAAYRAQEWEKAASAFRACLAITPEDEPSKVFLGRIAHFREAPPATDWLGVWELKTK